MNSYIHERPDYKELSAALGIDFNTDITTFWRREIRGATGIPEQLCSFKISFTAKLLFCHQGKLLYRIISADGLF
jgi:hypothetical protein